LSETQETTGFQNTGMENFGCLDCGIFFLSSHVQLNKKKVTNSKLIKNYARIETLKTFKYQTQFLVLLAFWKRKNLDA
jgi:hypothetical protein